MNSSIDVRNKSFDSGLIALLMFNKKDLKNPLNFPIHLKIPKVLIKKIFEDVVGEQIKITVYLDSHNYFSTVRPPIRLASNNYSLTVSPTTKLIEITSIFNENHKIQTSRFIEDSVFNIFYELQSKLNFEKIFLELKDTQESQLNINDFQVHLNKIKLMPDHKTLRDCAIQDGQTLVLISED